VLTLADVLPLLSAARSAWSSISVKVLSRTESANVIVVYMTLLITPILLVPSLFVWRWPDLASLGWLVMLGAFGTLGHLTMTRAFAAAEASAVTPFDFFRLPFIAIVAYLWFDERPEVWTWVGALVIVFSVLHLARPVQRPAAQAG